MALTADQLEHYKRTLLARRVELASETVRAEGAVGEEDESGRLDYGDRANSAFAKEDLLREAGRDSERLSEIDSALERIARKTYGFCVECGAEIPQARLDAAPWAALCVRDQEIREQHRREAGMISGGEPSRVVL